MTIKSVPFRECRLVKSRETGASRGFAFIEFNSIEEAQSWLEESKVIKIKKNKKSLKSYANQNKRATCQFVSQEFNCTIVNRNSTTNEEGVEDDQWMEFQQIGIVLKYLISFFSSLNLNFI